jgi:hypothetical protein
VECFSCPQLTDRRCSICNKDFFCSESCEEKRSGSHLFLCTGRPLTSADYLYKNIGEDTLPDDEDVLADFGFNQLDSFADRSKLLGLYKGLYLSEVRAEDLHRWQVEGSIVANVNRIFSQIPEQCRGGYFQWFSKHTHILERPLRQEEVIERTVANFYNQARLYLDSEDQDKQPNELQPEAKARCYQLLATTLHMAHPHPTETNWFNFGFCTCGNEWEEGRLGGLYQGLLLGDVLFDDVLKAGVYANLVKTRLQTASFTEFWRAYESGTLIQLMDSKGLKEMRSQFPFLEGFFAVPPCGPHPSVWSLKQFTVINDPVEFPPIQALKVDYGFMNCRNFEETCTLMEIYKRLLLAAGPLELHKACLAGKLFQFAERYHKMDDGYRRLMENIYPLPN